MKSANADKSASVTKSPATAAPLTKEQNKEFRAKLDARIPGMAAQVEAVELDTAMAAVASHLGLTPAALRAGASWIKKANDARSRIGSIRARLPQIGDASHGLKDKRAVLVEGTAYDASSLPDSDKKELASLVRITKAASILSGK